MGKNPAFQFYPSDWSRDLEEHPLEIEGAWIRICCKLWWEENRGSATKTLTQWSRVLRVGEKKSFTIIGYLLKQKIADVLIQNESITITSRRMIKDEHIRKIRASAGSMGGNPALKTQSESSGLVKQSLVKQKPTPSSSSSSSSSKKKPYTVDFETFYKAYPKKKAPDSAWKSWKKRNGDRPPIEVILRAIEIQKESNQWKKDGGQYIPHPATWLNQGRWDDEVEIEVLDKIEQEYKEKYGHLPGQLA